MTVLRAFGRGIFRFLQVLAFLAAIVTAVATVGAVLKEYRSDPTSARPRGFDVGASGA